MNLPTYSEIELLHKQYAPTNEAFEQVFTHCCIVRDVAQQLMSSGKFFVDTELVVAGCLLHDIGVYTLFDSTGQRGSNADYITHGIQGEEVLKVEGFPEAIWRFGSHHTGVGLTKHDIESQNLPLPPQGYEAESAEELLVMYADKFHSKTDPPYFNSYEWYRQYVARFGSGKTQKFEAMGAQFGIPELTPLMRQYGHALRPEVTP